MVRPVLIYLADLSHDGIRLSTESFPYNIGLVASYAKKHLGESIDIKLFKYVDSLLRALREQPPHILGCSNYVWNSNLSEWALKYAKRLRSDILTVQGGSNYPFTPRGQHEFLQRRPYTDLCVFYEGEMAFLNLLKRFLEVECVEGMKEMPIAGCQFLSPRDGTLVSGSPVGRLQRLDDVPSPYVTGLLDEFFDGKLTPMIETNRGCPFACNFCNAGEDYFDKIHMYSLDYVIDEIRYIAPRISAVGVSNLTIADNNFGIYRRDAAICEVLREMQETYRWPMGVMATTGKNNKDRIVRATEILGKSLLINMSVQSMNKEVLTNIKRDNIKLDTYTQINEVLTKQGRSQNAEIIFPLPGESYTSFMKGVKDLIDSGANKITSYTLQLNYGTDYKEPDYRRQHGYCGKWRLVPLNFGQYEGSRVFDVEEVAVSSRYATFEDYLRVREFAFVTETLYNNYIFWEVIRYLREFNISAYDWLAAVWKGREEFPGQIKAVLESFVAQTKSELWDSEAELADFYGRPENYVRLLSGEISGNVIYKHKALLIARHIKAWINHIIDVARNLVLQRNVEELVRERVTAELDALQRYIDGKLAGVLDCTADSEPFEIGFKYDVLSWLQSDVGNPLSAFRRDTPVTYEFYFDDKQRLERGDDFKRYGTDILGLSKILARVASHDRLFRQVREIERGKQSLRELCSFEASLTANSAAHGLHSAWKPKVSPEAGTKG